MPEVKPVRIKTVESLVPSSRLLRAAVSGLLSLGAGACAEDEDGEHGSHDAELTDDEVDALCGDKVDDAVDRALADQDVEALCSEMVSDAKSDCAPGSGDLPELCSDMVMSARTQLEATVSDLEARNSELGDEVAALEAKNGDLEDAVSDLEADKSDLEDQVADLDDTVADRDAEIAELLDRGRALLLTVEEKTISSEQMEYTFEELTDMCDDRGGYTQVHGACGGVNACAGFSYGDWGPDYATLTEHSCSGVNGCLGLSCVVLPEDSGRTGKEIYEFEEWEEPFNSCGGCHGGSYIDGEWVHDTSKFWLGLYPGDTRTVDNWLDNRSAALQERLVAFGTEGVLADGIAYQSMADYRHILSRAEIERVVEYIRTELDVVIDPIKTVDP